MTFRIDQVKTILQARWLVHRGPQTDIEHLLTDSRNLIFPGTSLFFALPGSRRHGHHYLEDLYERGVRQFVVDRSYPKPKHLEANVLQVDDVLESLQKLAAHRRTLFDKQVLAITGSNGKTIVKEWLSQLLEFQYRITRSPKSYNSQLGVPLSVWQLDEHADLGIFEAGISQPGEMGRLQKVIRPTIGLFTNIGQAHSEGFRDLSQKIREKLKLFTGAKVLIYNRDQKLLDSEIKRWSSSRKIKRFSWGKAKSNPLRVLDIQKEQGLTRVKLQLGKSILDLDLPFDEEASLQNALHAVAAYCWLEGNLAELPGQLLRLRPLAMRLELHQGINHCSVINDSYNADLSSLKIALDFLSQQHQHPRRTVILSDIPQSGIEDRKLYRSVADLLREKKIDRLVAIGEKIGAQQAELLEGKAAAELQFFPSVESFLQQLGVWGFRDETILLKGARSFQFERIDQALALQAHQTVMEINLNAMADNLKQYQALLRPSTRCMVMVKAFGYGTGSFEIANLLQFQKVDYLSVAYVDEGVALRKGGIRLPIMVMNAEPSGYEAVQQYQLEPVIYSWHQFYALRQFVLDSGIQNMPVHLEIDTGMHRLGFDFSQIDSLIQELTGSPFKVQTVFSHLSSSEEADQDQFSNLQAERFSKATLALKNFLGYEFLCHLANSAAIARFPEMQLDMVRLGVGLYGIDPAHSGRFHLSEVSTLTSTVAQIRELPPGETVGYNRRGVVDRPTRVATVAIGYADGYPRSLGNGTGKMWVKGHLAPTLGSICMDMTMLDVTQIPSLQEGDPVIVFGPELSVSQVAQWAGTIPYEILTGISQRVKRLYYQQ